MLIHKQSIHVGSWVRSRRPESRTLAGHLEKEREGRTIGVRASETQTEMRPLRPTAGRQEIATTSSFAPTLVAAVLGLTCLGCGLNPSSAPDSAGRPSDVGAPILVSDASAASALNTAPPDTGAKPSDASAPILVPDASAAHELDTAPPDTSRPSDAAAPILVPDASAAHELDTAPPDTGGQAYGASAARDASLPDAGATSTDATDADERNATAEGADAGAIAFQWVAGLMSTSMQFAGLAASTTGVAVAGYGRGVTVGADSLPGDGSTKFLARWGSAGTLNALSALPLPGGVNAIAMDGSGGLAIAGQYFADAQVATASGSVWLRNTGGSDIYVARLSPTGDIRWIASAGLAHEANGV